jgi:hypothetical protein
MRVHYVNTTNATDQARTPLSLGATSRTMGVHVGIIFLRHSGFTVAPDADGGVVTVTSSTTPFTAPSWIFAPWSFASPLKAEIAAPSTTRRHAWAPAVARSKRLGRSSRCT